MSLFVTDPSGLQQSAQTVQQKIVRPYTRKETFNRFVAYQFVDRVERKHVLIGYPRPMYNWITMDHMFEYALHGG